MIKDPGIYSVYPKPEKLTESELKTSLFEYSEIR